MVANDSSVSFRDKLKALSKFIADEFSGGISFAVISTSREELSCILRDSQVTLSSVCLVSKRRS